jgi:hypothetical protein
MKNKEKTPFKEWDTWSCLSKVNVPIAKKCRLRLKTADCVFLDYAFHSVGYIFLIIKSGVLDMYVGTIMESRDVTFLKLFFL